MSTDHSTTPLRGKCLHDVALSGYTSWRVGGLAKTLYQPADIDDLATFIATLDGREPLAWIGLGSNLLVRDGGFNGTVIATSPGLGEIRVMDETHIYADCGVACNKLARTAAKAGMGGQEFLAGIPGTLGGALAMNAGAWQGETWPLVETVRTVDRNGRLRERGAHDYEVGYRSVSGPEGEWFVGATLSLEVEQTDLALSRIREMLAERNRSQPSGLPSCGSVFRNPPGDHAARLIEASGLKGYCMGNACVSVKHANFIINTGRASAADIEALIEFLRTEIRQQHNVELICEVRILGDAA